jgi:protein-arginine kinase activator protein McsA
MQHFVSDNTSASVSKYDLKDELEELKSLLSQALVDEDYNRANDINNEIKKIKSKLK